MFGNKMKNLKSQFYRLKKKLPDLNKQSLEWFTKWWETRQYIQKKIDKQKLEIEDLKNFWNICINFNKFISYYSKDYEKHKIDWKVMIKYLEQDKEFCENIAKQNKILVQKTKELKKEYFENKTENDVIDTEVKEVEKEDNK